MTGDLGIVDLPSPNQGPRPDGSAADLLLLHYTGMRSAEAALARLRDPAAEVSAHYLIDEDGRTCRLVPEERRAWHAGVSSWAGRRNVNDFSIGIELVNPGHEFGYRPFPDAQMQALLGLARDICRRHGIQARRVLGHSDVAPARKQDPGELFDWRWLARHGVGLWPEEGEGSAPAAVDEPSVDWAWAQDRLAAIGYAVPGDGRTDADKRYAITAFQRHFLPSRVDGELNLPTMRRLLAVAAAFAIEPERQRI